MLEDIKNAKKSIYLESFILTDDRRTHEFFKTIKEKARAGLKVKIIMDRIGGWWGSINEGEFGEAGVEILIFTHWFHSSHRKVLIVDEEVAYLGGVNISGQYAKWIDLQVRLTGFLVRTILRSFSRVYELSGGKDPMILGVRKRRGLFKAQIVLYKAKIWFLENWPFKGRSRLRAYYKKKCREAKHKIVIATPYFIPHRWLVKLLREAAHRGVRVEVIIPEETDVRIVDIAHRVFAKKLAVFINFFFIPEMNHAKVLLIDDREGLVGSNNIDARSFDFQLEASVVFRRKDMVGDLRQILERWEKMAVPLGKVNPYDKWYHKIIKLLIKLLQPLL